MSIRKTKRSNAPTVLLCEMAQRLGWKIGRTTKHQKTQLRHPKSGSIVMLPLTIGSRNIDEFRRLLERGAKHKL